MASNDATMNIPLETVVSHTPSKAGYSEKGGLFHRGIRGRRRLAKIDSKGNTVDYKNDDDQTSLNRMGVIYFKILNFNIITRYFIYVLPLALIIAIPLIIGATSAPNARIGGVRMVWFFTWFEIVWLSLWVGKIIAHFLPMLFMFLAGVVSAGTRKYALVIKKLELPLSLLLWAITSLVTLTPIMTLTPGGIQGDRNWLRVVRSLLSASVAAACIFLAERVLIQLISINYHRKQFDSKIKDSKRNIHLLSLLYDASRALFPAYCNEFAEEDYIINDTLGINSKKTTGSATPLRLIHDVGRFGDKVTAAFGNVASELAGKEVFRPDSAHSIVVEALEKNRSAEALAKRLWMSFVVEGKNALYKEDIIEVLGASRQAEAEECFSAIDRDGNGDISLDEMIMAVAEFGRERKSISNSMHDVDQAIRVLDGLLNTIVFIMVVFVFVAFLNRNFVTTLATAGTALLSLSFIFAGTCQEVLGSCIFLFVKHPFDIGDRVDLGVDQLTVEHISLLFTQFKRVNTGKMVQIPNIVLNGLWVENVSRSKSMREQIYIFVNFDTSFEDIKALKAELQNFVLDKENNRDFQPEIEVEVTGIAEMNKLELRAEIRHKSNWANETVRAARRSKFMCALVLALRKIPVYGPGGGDAALGDIGKPSFSVLVSAAEAQKYRDEYAANKEAKRLYPTKKPESPENDNQSGVSGIDYLGGRREGRAVETLNARSPATDFARDNVWTLRDDANAIGRPNTENRPDLDEVRVLLRAASTSGKRRSPEPMSPLPNIAEPSASVYHSPSPGPYGYITGSRALTQPTPPTRRPVPGNAFAQPPYPGGQQRVP
ncbi:serine/threonine protein kinase-like protein [Patellaria atrata CBS 101060]|uniref:Mechanosensitive ion channel protein n=1 Tax=Patellaria atrata CBS 101060 TaxID=1346257 RepID=A0A9P4S276_9PEZI|nr:serine/threonine protein kinase-like protein [Patellaria atrata CBS 101060]